MKNISIILNAVLIIAVGILYYLHFSCKKQCPVTPTTTVTKEKAEVEETILNKDIISSITTTDINSNFPIAFVNLDSLNAKSDFINALSKKIEKKAKQKNQVLDKQKQDFQNQYKTIAENYQMGVYKTEQELAAKQQELAQREQELGMAEQKMMSELEKERRELTKQINKKVTDFLEIYSAKSGYPIILATGVGSSVLFAADSLNITSPVISSLNNK